MSPAEIQDILEAHPNMTYEDVKKQAINAGVDLNQFNEAWHAYLMKTRKAPASKVWGQLTIIALIILSLVGFDTAYWHFFIKAPSTVLSDAVGKLSIYASGIVVLHLSSKFGGAGRSPISATLKLSLFLLFVTYLAHYASLITTTVTYIVVLFGGVLIGFFVLYAISRTYDMDVPRTILGTFLFCLMMSLVIEFTMGLDTFKSYFSGSGVKDVTMENVVDIAEEKTDKIIRTTPR